MLTSLGTKITYPGDGDVYLGGVASNMVVTVVEMAHPLFTRAGNNLRYKVSISIPHALAPFLTFMIA